MVLDVPALIRELAKADQDAVYKIEPLNDEELKFDKDGNLISATVYSAGRAIKFMPAILYLPQAVVMKLF